MKRQWLGLVGLAVMLTGCANEGLPGAGAGFATSAVTGSVPGTTVAGYAGAGAADAQEVPRKTMASKVLAAIALERVTGRKPDPARLTELP